MGYWFLFNHSSLNSKLMMSSCAFLLMSILLFNIGFAVGQEHQQKPKSTKIRFPGPSGYSRKYQHLEQLDENQPQPPNLSSNSHQQAVENPTHLALVTPPCVTLPMKQEEYELPPDTTPKQEENTNYNQPSIDVNEILFYPD